MAFQFTCKENGSTFLVELADRGFVNKITNGLQEKLLLVATESSESPKTIICNLYPNEKKEVLLVLTLLFSEECTYCQEDMDTLRLALLFLDENGRAGSSVYKIVENSIKVLSYKLESSYMISVGCFS